MVMMSVAVIVMIVRMPMMVMPVCMMIVVAVVRMMMVVCHECRSDVRRVASYPLGEDVSTKPLSPGGEIENGRLH